MFEGYLVVLCDELMAWGNYIRTLVLLGRGVVVYQWGRGVIESVALGAACSNFL